MRVTIYSDGACSGNPGSGGYCAILKCNGSEKIVSGYEEDTTNNRMELTAVIEGLKLLNTHCEVTVISDSKYVCDAVNQNWLQNWKCNGWRKSNHKPVLNTDLWQELDALLETHKVVFQWIQGHVGHPENERCDKIAVSEYTQHKKTSRSLI
ncbi:MAG: ribonuclease HI [Ruminococcus sp.]|nr:ribonuclease HI [Ruminococcus sp.]